MRYHAISNKEVAIQEESSVSFLFTAVAQDIEHEEETGDEDEKRTSDIEDEEVGEDEEKESVTQDMKKKLGKMNKSRSIGRISEEEAAWEESVAQQSAAEKESSAGS